MTIKAKIGRSRTEIYLTKEEYAAYKAAPPRSYERRDILRNAWTRNTFGSVENAIRAVKKFEEALKTLPQDALKAQQED